MRVLMAWVLCAVGCASDPSWTKPSPDKATLEISTTWSQFGTALQLEAELEITDADGAIFRTRTPRADPNVTVYLPPGDTQIELLDGWQLFRSDDNGPFQLATATLRSDNPSTVTLEVEHDLINFVELRFDLEPPPMRH